MKSFPPGTAHPRRRQGRRLPLQRRRARDARYNGLAAKLLLVDDDGYGVLREYQRDAFGETFAVDLVQPDFTALARTFGLPFRSAGPESLADDLAWALDVEGPAAVVLSAYLEMFVPTG